MFYVPTHLPVEERRMLRNVVDEENTRIHLKDSTLMVANRALLAYHSPEFASLITESRQYHPCSFVMDLQRTSIEIMEIALRFFKKRRLTFNEITPHLFQFACDYKVKKLIEYICDIVTCYAPKPNLAEWAEIFEKNHKLDQRFLRKFGSYYLDTAAAHDEKLDEIMDRGAFSDIPRQVLEAQRQFHEAPVIRFTTIEHSSPDCFVFPAVVSF